VELSVLTSVECRSFVKKKRKDLCFGSPRDYYRNILRSVLLCFIKPILGNRYVRSRDFIVSEPRETHSQSEIADVPTSPCPPLDNLSGSSPFTFTTSLLYQSPPLPLRTDPATTTLTTRSLCPDGSIVWAGPKFVRPH